MSRFQKLCNKMQTCIELSISGLMPLSDHFRESDAFLFGRRVAAPTCFKDPQEGVWRGAEPVRQVDGMEAPLDCAAAVVESGQRLRKAEEAAAPSGAAAHATDNGPGVRDSLALFMKV